MFSDTAANPKVRRLSFCRRLGLKQSDTFANSDYNSACGLARVDVTSATFTRHFPSRRLSHDDIRLADF